MSIPATRLLLITVLVISLAMPLHAAVKLNDDSTRGTPENPHIIPHANSPIRVDGVLEDEAWGSALKLELNFEIEPGENVEPPVRTEVTVTYDKRCLYVGFRCFDPDPSAIRARFQDHDRCTSDDMATIIIDTFNDERRSFILSTNPVGSKYDAIKTQNGEDSSWDGIWDSAGRIFDWGFSAEMAIPFTSLRFQRSETDQVWGFEAWRVYPRSNRHIIGSVPIERGTNCLLCQFGKIKGFAGADPGINLEIIPTVTAIKTDARTDLPDGKFETRDEKADVGISARWSITPNLTLNATANPDFSQVEADAVQLDVNQPFALFYQEKRPFFTEGRDFFRGVLPAVYTRTMRDPSWGVKLTGKEGANTIGAYLVRDELTNLIFPGSQSSSATSMAIESTAAVFRYKRDIGNKYTLGALATDREGGDYFNRLFGFDGTFRITDKDRFLVQALRSSTRYPDDVAADFGQQFGEFGDSAFVIDFLHGTRSLDWFVIYRDVGDNFRADLGFMPQVGYRVLDVGWGYTWNGTPEDWWTMFNFGSGFVNAVDRTGSLLNRTASFWFNYRGPPQSAVDVDGGWSREAYNGKEFELKTVHIGSWFQPTANLFLELHTHFGNRIDYDNTRLGNRIQINPHIVYRIGRHLRITFFHLFQHMTVDDGWLFNANISGSWITYQFSTRSFLRSIFQYQRYDYNTGLYSFPIDPESKRLFTQILFSYKINPQTVLYLGYSDNYFGDHSFGLAQTDRTFFVKLGYAWVL